MNKAFIICQDEMKVDFSKQTNFVVGANQPTT